MYVCLRVVKEKEHIPGHKIFPNSAVGVPGHPGSGRFWVSGEVRATNMNLKDKRVYFTFSL